MRRALLLGLALLLTACAPRATTPPEGRPPLVPPAVAYRLRLEAPGSTGEITLTTALEYLMGRSNKALPTYRVDGTITHTDDLGTWRFSFAPLDILDPESLAQVHGIGVQFRNGLRDTIEVVSLPFNRSTCAKDRLRPFETPHGTRGSTRGVLRSQGRCS